MVKVDEIKKEEKVIAVLYQISASRFMVAWANGQREIRYESEREVMAWFRSQKVLSALN